MYIQYVGGATVRQACGLEWSRANGYVVDVPDGRMAANLLTQPGKEFEIAESEPLKVMGAADEVIFELASAGIDSVSTLAADDSGRWPELTAKAIEFSGGLR
jgi:hypothetical protein